MISSAGETQLNLQRSPRPTGSRDACLVNIYPPGPAAGRRHALAARPLLIGRGDDCDIRPDDNSVSRKHARIDPTPTGYLVTDEGSSNGTFVNDQPLAGTQPLRDGDYLRVGNCLFRYLAGGNVEAEYHEEIYRLTIQDGLTRAYNRRALAEFLDREVVRSQRHARPLSVLLFDIDKFKSVNDTFGHQCGDFVLRELADVVRGALRREDMLARYGGEEFALVLVETEHAAAVMVAERLRASVEAHPFRYADPPLRVTVSIGVATTCGDMAATPDDLLRVADDRLYRAKRGGRNRVLGEESQPVG